MVAIQPSGFVLVGAPGGFAVCQLDRAGEVGIMGWCPELAGSSVEELAGLVAQLRSVNAGLRKVIEDQAARIAKLERRLGLDSSTSSRPPSSDLPYHKPERRSSREPSGRRPGRQPGAPGSAMRLVDDRDEVIVCDPGWCRGCGADLSGAPVGGMARRQVTDVAPPPPPRVTEYQILTLCPGCAARAVAVAPRSRPPGRATDPWWQPGRRSYAERTTCRWPGRRRR